MKPNLLLILKLIYFYIPFGMKFILRLNFPSSWIIRRESYFFRLWNTTGIFWFDLTFDITISMYRASIFSSDMTMISYFNIIINIIIITDPTFSHHKFFVKMFFDHITTTFTFFNHTANKTVKSIFAKVLNFSSTHIIYNHNYKKHVFDICFYKTHIDFAFFYLQALDNFQNLHKSWMVILFFFQSFWI